MDDWYHADARGESAGPVSRQRLQELVAAGTVKRTTLVRQASRREWITAGSVPLLRFPPRPRAAAAGTGGRSWPGPSRRYAPIDFHRPFVLLVVLAATSLPAAILLFRHEVLLAVVLTACLMGALASWCLLLYRAWDQVQGIRSRTNPGRAVAFLLIPFFNRP